MFSFDGSYFQNHWFYIPYPRECNPGVLLIFWVFRPRTVVYFGEKSAKITVFLADFSPKMTKVRPKYVAWGCIQDGVVFTRIRYYILAFFVKKPFSYGLARNSNIINILSTINISRENYTDLILVYRSKTISIRLRET